MEVKKTSTETVGNSNGEKLTGKRERKDQENCLDDVERDESVPV